MDMAERLQDLRKKSNYSQEQVSDMLGISRQTVSKWESGQGKPEKVAQTIIESSD
ncbi:helix-turn-helix transcriptional regulator [Oscillibacter sp.]|uniref:helix-turn-helix transcriptional regulator n=1 Tax=Oscillibacter sp. TaxID=1945593 RepID=UPI00289D97E6|nr:helix-turn-helix transcriptional regulator [Oscillibacter sp.]